MIGCRLSFVTPRAMLALLLVGVWSSTAISQDWTRFRGPNGAGESDATTVPGTWTEQDFNWRIKLPGEGIAAPVAWGGRLFVTSSDPKTATQYILCLDAKTGQEFWRREYPSSVHTLHSLNTFASSTPAVDGEFLYVAWADPKSINLVALRHDGTEAWHKDLGPFVSQHGFGTSPILVDDLVVLGNDQGDEEKNGTSFLVALDRKSGDERWRTPRKTREVAYSTPCVYKADADSPPQLIFNSGAEGITSVDAKTGKVNWQIDLFDKRSCSSPIIVNDLIFGSCGNGAGGGNYVVAVRAPNGKERSAPEVAYRMTKASLAPYVPGFVANGDYVYMWSDRGFVSCMEAATGKIVWQERVGGKAFYGSPIRVGDKLYCMEVTGDVYVVAADPKYKFIAKNPLGERGNSTPAVVDGVMYLRTVSQLISLGGKK